LELRQIIVNTRNDFGCHRFTTADAKISKEKTDMRLKIMIGFAALALGAAFASAPASAYDAVPGYNSQGAVIAIPHARHHSLYNRGQRKLYNQSLPKGGATVQ
jgi:hypothetical protein